jgi:hypothetical protein
MREGTTPRVMAADRFYGEFYDFYSVIPEYFGYHLVLILIGQSIDVTFVKSEVSTAAKMCTAMFSVTTC